LVPKSVTLNYREWRNDPYFVKSYEIRQLWKPTTCT